MNKKKLVFSGIQPTGNLHLGNYLGALKNFVTLQDETDCIYCVVDLHAITTFQNPNELKKNVLETVASFVATGLNPDKSIIFNQSSVTGHSELAWILNCVSRIGWYESVMLPRFAVAIYDVIMGSEMLQDWKTHRKGLDFFIKYFPKQYMVLLD